MSVIPGGSVPENTEYTYGANPFDMLLNGLKLVIAVFCKPATDVVVPAIATTGNIDTAKLTVTVVPEICPDESCTAI